MPEGFGRFGIPGVWFLSCCPPAVMGFCLPVGGFCPRNWEPLSLWGHLTIPSSGEIICFTRSISTSSHVNLLLLALLLLGGGILNFSDTAAISAPSCLPPQADCYRHYFAHGRKLGLCCVPLLPCFEKLKQKLKEKTMERAGGGGANTWTSLLKVRLSWLQKRG